MTSLTQLKSSKLIKEKVMKPCYTLSQKITHCDEDRTLEELSLSHCIQVSGGTDTIKARILDGRITTGEVLLAPALSSSSKIIFGPDPALYDEWDACIDEPENF